MGQNQSDRQASIRAVTGTAWTYEGDWHALFDQAGIASGDYNGRLLAWINQSMGASYAELNGAMSAFAASQSAPSWNEMGTFTPGSAPVAAWDASTSTLAQLAVLATHTRTSLATMFDSTGKLTYAPNNLLTYSNTFSNVAWTPAQAGASQVPLVTDNYGTDPLGGSTAARIVLRLNGGTTSSDISYLTRSVSTAAAGLSSIWMKSTDGISALKVNLRGGSGAAVQKTVTGTWQQFYVTAAAGAVDRFQISIYGNDAGVSNTTDILVWSAVSAAVTYETTPRTGDQVITTSAAYYGPRIDYTYSSTPGLLDETSSRTKSLVQSNALSNASWLRNVVGAPVQNVTGIDGTTSAWTITASGTADTFLYQTGSFVGPYAYSAVFKAGTNNWAYIAANGGGNKRAYVFFDLTNGVVGSTTFRPDGAYAGTLTGYGIIPLGNGFYRCWVAVTGTTDTYVAFGLSDANASITTTNGRTFVASDLEAEAGAFPTSITRTTASSVTRAADALTAASLTTNPAIIQYRSISTGTRARTVINPWSGISSETNEWIEAIRIYPSGTGASYLNTKLTVDGPW